MRFGNYEINQNHIAWRDNYLRTLPGNRNLSQGIRMREIYTDESYIHHQNKNENENLYHPETNGQDERRKYKGRRFCFVAAIRGHGNSESANLISNPSWIFAPSPIKGHVGDCHKFLISKTLHYGSKTSYYQIRMKHQLTYFTMHIIINTGLIIFPRRTS